MQPAIVGNDTLRIGRVATWCTGIDEHKAKLSQTRRPVWHEAAMQARVSDPPLMVAIEGDVYIENPG